ncbi:hypothetical protein SSX86_009591 [Deinandra increscens subsp. villosa]|uniref:PGG domain-containing protein n=1 Tax=Deinandra increscens subsp. villosa TaxID=3103831 RepID=A0AAP0H175_9ASTR
MANALDVSAPNTQDLKYMQASNVNVSGFVSVRLSSQTDYRVWKAQMVCLIETQRLRGVIDIDCRLPGDNIEQYEQLVKGWIFGSIDKRIFKKLESESSARQVWKKLESFYDPQIDSTTAASPGFIFRTEFVRVPEITDAENIARKNKLYKATVEGCWWKAKSILKNYKDAALKNYKDAALKNLYKDAVTQVISENGNTMLHLAVEMGHNYFVEKLLNILEDEDIETKNINGRTALHIAAMVGNQYAAQLLVQKRKQLLRILDDKAQSPLENAYNNKKLNTYAYLLNFEPPRSSDLRSYPDTYQKNAVYLIVSAILTKQYDLASTLLKRYPDFAMRNDQILLAIAKNFPTDLSFTGSFIYPSLNNVSKRIVVRSSLLFHYDVLHKCVEDVFLFAKSCKNTCFSWLGIICMILFAPTVTLYLIYELICLLTLVIRFPFSLLYFLVWKVVTVCAIKNIEKKKNEYKEAKMILSLICDQMGTSNSCYTKPILEAVRQDAYEVVDEILFRSPNTINCEDEEGHNVIQLAIINRSEKVYNLIYHIIERTESYRTMKDSLKNNLLHLAVRLAPSFVLGRTTGAALQLQRELQWREEVEKFMLPLELLEENIYMETPAMLFDREHEALMKQGENWIKTTAESCSITAALIVTVVFAAAITVPGGSNQESGNPVFRKEIAFTIFAVSNALSLFTAATALLLFLSILTTRFSERDFLVSLPRRLIFGLFTLFLSTTAMILAFGAILFLVFCDQRPWMLAPLVGFACFPISVIVTIKLPLLLDLFQSTYFPIFGEQRYIDSCQTNRKNTIFIR